MEEEYKAKMVEQAFKVEEANAELDKLLVLEKARQIQMEEEDEQRREEERQKLLLANEAVLKELEEAEAEQARMDAEEAEARRQFELEATAAEDAQRAKSTGSQAEYDAKIAADQALLDKQITDSEKTGDTEQQAERRAALDLEAQSKRDASILSEEEQQRGREAAAKLAADSEAGGTVVEDEGEPPVFDYDAYMRGDPIPCTVKEWGVWKKVGGLSEETETITSGTRMKRTYERMTGRWKQGWKREREVVSPALNGGTCVTEESRYTSQASTNCEESDWNEWKNVGAPFQERKGNKIKWFQKRERDRKTAVVADGCNIRYDTMNTELSPEKCKYSELSPWSNVGNAYEQTKKVARRRGGGYNTVKTGKWVIKQESTRSIAAQPKYGGSECRTTEATLKKTRENVLNPVNCGVSNWGGWVSRGGDHVDRKCVSLGLRQGRSCTDTYYQLLKRNRFITRHPAYGGNGCPHLEEHKNVERPKINCLMSWGGWQNNGRGKKVCTGRRPKRCRTVQPQIRYATITRPAAYGGSCGSTTQKR
tara:strand:- start:95 stop:1705 length:1611 start_codon:yes stop_codon:yes gene_type:complete